MLKRVRFFLFLSWRDFISSYHGSALGLVWAVLEPVLYISLTYFFFQFVMRGPQVAGHAYATYVLPSMLAWLAASTTIQSSVSAVSQYSFFLHETFDMRALAVIKMLPIFVVHLLMLGFLIAVFAANADTVSPLRLCYAILSLISILTGLFWLLMSIGPFLKDVKNVVGIALQFGFWVTPIFWERDQFPGVLSWVMFFNPFYYPVEAYRLAFTRSEGRYLSLETAYFWLVCIFLLFFGTRVYSRAKPHFGDVVT